MSSLMSMSAPPFHPITVSEGSVRQWSNKRGQVSLSDRAREYLRARHPAKTGEAVEAATRGRVRAEAFRKAEQRGGSMNAEAFAALIAAYGPDFLAAILPGLDWLSDAARAERQRALMAEQARLSAELEALGRRV